MNHISAGKDKYLKGDFLGDDLHHGHGRRPLQESCVRRGSEGLNMGKKVEATISFRVKDFGRGLRGIYVGSN